MDMNIDFDAIAEQMRSDVSAAIRAEREARGWTQADLATASGVNAQQVGRFERGAREPGLNDLVRIAAAFGLTVGGFSTVAEDLGRRIRKTPEMPAQRSPSSAQGE